MTLQVSSTSAPAAEARAIGRGRQLGIERDQPRRALGHGNALHRLAAGLLTWFSQLVRKGETYMIAHTSLAVSDYKKSKAFFTKALAPLGYTNNMEYDDAAGFNDGKNTDFWISREKSIVR